MLADVWPTSSLQPRFTPAGASSQSVAAQIHSILSPPLYATGPEEPFGPGQVPELNQERIRQAEGPAQILVGESSRQIYTDLINPPPLKPVDWLRSRTRRDLHISLGVPINLDEIMYLDSSASSSSPGGSSRRLPPLAINFNNGTDRAQRTRSDGTALKAPNRQDSASSSSSAGIGPSNGAGQTNASGTRSQSRDQGRKERIAEKRREDLGLGPLPEVDMQRVEQVSNLSEGECTSAYLEIFRLGTDRLPHHHCCPAHRSTFPLDPALAQVPLARTLTSHHIDLSPPDAPPHAARVTTGRLGDVQRPHQGPRYRCC